MKEKIEKIIRSDKRIERYAKVFSMLLNSKFFKIDGGKRKYPKVIQLPLTYKCNSRCVMCNIWRMDHSNEVTVEEFSQFISDPIFKKVQSIGINGGEPSLIPDLPKFVLEILKLPKINSISIISHGFSTYPLLKSLSSIYRSCNEKNVKLHVSISLDGVGEIHNLVRGRANVFEKTIDTLNNLKANKQLYCDDFDISCTIVKQNVDYLIELNEYVKQNNFKIRYRLGIENKRIESDKLTDQFSVLYSSEKQSALEFFHFLWKHAVTLEDRFKYFALFYQLNSPKPKRLLGCSWKDEGITVDSRGAVYYCAVASKKIGSLRKDSGEQIFLNRDNIEYRKTIIREKCDSCIHDYNGKLELKNILIFLKDILNTRFEFHIYKLKTRIL